ncbi:uncharacterized protein [Miscanthus floridulus]|uniref:uncharacterized protein n=1 Tax=Miscanthus floridulus TaxID=154761 RepID=UPI00345A163A
MREAKESMMKPFIVIKLIFKKRYQVQDSASWLPQTKIMHDSVELKSAYVSQMMLTLMILFYDTSDKSSNSDDVHHSVTASSIDQLVYGLKDYTLFHGNTCDKCGACSLNRAVGRIQKKQAGACKWWQLCGRRRRRTTGHGVVVHL